MLEAIRDIFFSRRDGDAPMNGTVAFDLKMVRVDSQREDITRSFTSREERDAFVDAYLVKPRQSRQIDQVIYEDTLVFWRSEKKDDPVPTEFPHLDGPGELLLRVHGNRDTVLEATTDIKMAKIVDLFAQDKYGWIEEMSVLRRQVVYERRSVLVKLDQVPTSALKFESADYADE